MQNENLHVVKYDLAYPTFSVPKGADHYAAGALLLKEAVAARDGHDLRGFRLFFGYTEVIAHKRVSPALRINLDHMTYAARNEGRSIQLFRNALGELALKLL